MTLQLGDIAPDLRFHEWIGDSPKPYLRIVPQPKV